MYSTPGLALAFSLCYLPLAKAWSGGSGGGYSNFPQNYGKIKIAHAVLGSLAWVIFFPLGTILLRLLKSRHTVRTHGIIQVFAYTQLIATAGTGIWMANTTHQLNVYHSIIGLVLLAFALIQVLAGLIQHSLFKAGHKTAVLNVAHVWFGRFLILLGMINGGLGLLLSDEASRGEYIAYGVVAAVIYFFYITVVITVRRKINKEQANSDTEQANSNTVQANAGTEQAKSGKEQAKSDKEFFAMGEHDARCTCGEYRRHKESGGSSDTSP